MSGTSALPQPSSESEIQLYHVLQRSNLLQYYNTFISQGGDDVQQLCEAGEEEFLEIMALVGMASKPLHVRRLQKALQEWAVNPVSFQQSIGLSFPPPMSAPLQGSIMAAVHKRSGFSTNKTPGMEPMWTAHNMNPSQSVETPRQMMSPADSGAQYEGRGARNGEEGDSRPASNGNCSIHSNGADHRPVSPASGEWTNAHMKAIAESAEKLAKTLPQFESRIQNPKKQINKEIEEVIKFVTDNPEHPDTIELTRKYAAIYGRFDSKRKGEKPMSHHEISVNEAASQLCRFRPTLLTRRDDLFPLARQVVRSSGYPYSKGHSRAQSSDSPPNKKIKTDNNTISIPAQTPRDLERLSEITREIASVTRRQDELKERIEQAREEENLSLLHALQTELESLTSKQLLLLSEQSDTHGAHRHHLRTYPGVQYTRKPNSLDDEDSFHAYTDTSSPPNGSDTSLEPAAPKANESLFDAGMEIAEQYGLGEFAKELQGMRGDQTVKPEVKTVNGTSENESGKDDDEGEKTTETVVDQGEKIIKEEERSS